MVLKYIKKFELFKTDGVRVFTQRGATVTPQADGSYLLTRGGKGLEAVTAEYALSGGDNGTIKQRTKRSKKSQKQD